MTTINTPAKPENETQQERCGGSLSTDLLASAAPRQVRSEMAETIEDIGNAMCLLREAINDTDQGNVGGGKLCASDALEIISGLETRYSQIAAKLAMWSEDAIDAYGDDDENAGECLECGASLQVVRPGKHQCPLCG